MWYGFRVTASRVDEMEVGPEDDLDMAQHLEFYKEHNSILLDMPTIKMFKNIYGAGVVYLYVKMGVK